MKKKHIVWIIILVVIILVIVGGIVTRKKTVTLKDDGKLSIVTSFYPLYFFTLEIAGDKANVINIMPTGAEPHEYEPTARDIAQIEDSDILVLNGGGLESWGDNIKTNLADKSTEVITAGEGLTTKTFIADEGDNIGQEVTDPHIWLSPTLAKQMVDKIELGIATKDPQNVSYYLENANTLKNKLDTLNEEYKEGLSNCKSNKIITSHMAFAYLADAYGLEQISIAGLSPDEEPSSKEMTKIVEWAKENNIKYVFSESLVSPKLSETIASEIGAETMVLNPVAGLTPDEIKAGKNYITEMETNLSNLQTALQCN